MVTEKQKREQTGLGQDQPSGQTSITDPAGTSCAPGWGSSCALGWDGSLRESETEQFVDL